MNKDDIRKLSQAVKQNYALKITVNNEQGDQGHAV